LFSSPDTYDFDVLLLIVDAKKKILNKKITNYNKQNDKKNRQLNVFIITSFIVGSFRYDNVVMYFYSPKDRNVGCFTIILPLFHFME
jgi:hypothetical protein